MPGCQAETYIACSSCSGSHFDATASTPRLDAKSSPSSTPRPSLAHSCRLTQQWAWPSAVNPHAWFLPLQAAGTAGGGQWGRPPLRPSVPWMHGTQRRWPGCLSDGGEPPAAGTAHSRCDLLKGKVPGHLDRHAGAGILAVPQLPTGPVSLIDAQRGTAGCMSRPALLQRSSCQEGESWPRGGGLRRAPAAGSYAWRRQHAQHAPRRAPCCSPSSARGLQRRRM